MKGKKIIEVDLERLLSALWKKKILIAFISVLFAVMTVAGSVLFTVPKYQADILLYVNNSSISLGSTSLSFTTGELTAARQLLNSYVVALKSRTCLDTVIEKADLPYTRDQLKNMIDAESVNNTEWFTVTVTSDVPEEARIIADTIAEVLPDILSNTIKGSSVEVVDFAIMPENKVSPGYATYAEFGFIFGFAFIVIIVIIMEILNDKIRTEETLNEMYDAVPVLAEIPHSGNAAAYAKRGHKKGRRGSQKNRYYDKLTPVCNELDFAASEAYKLLQTSVQYSFENEGGKVIGITSSERNEGKSTLAVNLAYMLSSDKKKVLLIDADLRLPSVAKKLGLESTPGLSDYLTGRARDNEGIRHSAKAPELSVICAGIMPPNPFSLLGSASMERLLNSMKEQYDYIVVDLPPVNIVSDPLAIAKYLDGFIVVARGEYSTRKGVQEVIEKLNVVNANIIGFVLNVNANSIKKKYRSNSYKNRDDYEKSFERAAARKKVMRPVPVSPAQNNTAGKSGSQSGAGAAAGNAKPGQTDGNSAEKK